MKAIVCVMILALSGLTVVAAASRRGERDEEVSKKIAAFSSEVARARIHYFDSESKSVRSFVLTDQDWIDRFVELLKNAEFITTGHILAISPPVTLWDKDGHFLIELQVFESIVRVNSKDYLVGTETGLALRALIEKARANQSPQTTPVSAPR
jgi:hypothetical protein